MSDDVAPASAPTMHEIAERAGVGKATVSLALRDDPRLRPETRRRIQKLAAKMGYRTNATVANLMAQLRASRTPRYQATLGLLNVSSDPRKLTQRTFREWAGGCAERAMQLGYGLDQFWLHEPGVSPARLVEILESRNIRGLIVAALLDHAGLPEEHDSIWQRFACVVAGVRPTWPSLNFCTNDHFSTASQSTHRLWACGYRRIGLVLSPDTDTLVDRRFSAGFWAGLEELGSRDRIPPFPFHHAREASFHAWVAQHRPEVILCNHFEVRRWLEEMRIRVPEEVGLAHLDWQEEHSDWAGMLQNNTLVGAACVEMLVGQLHRNEVGLPKFTKSTFIQSTWVDGATIARRIPRRRPAHKTIEAPMHTAAA